MESRLKTSQLLAYAAPTVALQAMLVPLYNFLPPVYYSSEVGKFETPIYLNKSSHNATNELDNPSLVS